MATFQPGDTVSGVAQSAGISQADFLAANPSITNPNVIKAGASYNLPTTTSNTGTGTGVNIPPGTGTANGATLPPPDSSLLDALTKKLMDSSGVVTSDTTDMDKLIQQSIDQTTQGNTADRTATQANYERQKQDAQNQGALDLVSGQDEQRNLGAASSLAVLNKIKDHTDKTVKDLDLREQEALATGDAATAKAISDIKMQQIQFHQKAVQDTFSNLLSVANFKMQQDSQTFNQNNTMLTHLIDSGAIASYNPQQLADFATKSGYNIGELSNIQKAISLKQNQLSNVSSTQDDNGNVTVWGTDKNNKLVNLGTLSAVGKTKAGQMTSDALGNLASSSEGVSALTGTHYIDTTNLSAKDKSALMSDPKYSGYAFVNNAQAQQIDNISTAAQNLQDMQSYIQPLLPQGATWRNLGGAASNKLAQYFQTDEDKASFSVWSESAFSTIKALGAAGRLTTTQLNLAVNNQPKLTDTLATANNKISILNGILKNTEQSIVTKDKSSLLNTSNTQTSNTWKSSSGNVYKLPY